MIPHVTLKNGVFMPQFGLGVFQTPPAETEAAVSEALRLGYPLIDTAAVYGNEREVGQAIKAAGLPRDQVFIETKIWINDFGYDETLHSFAKSAANWGWSRLRCTPISSSATFKASTPPTAS
ncbi:aldo/keto reductase [Donghicola mangrovi]|uniref:aldo/keto reductase n=1 Tax=Donghicola mangrovi TaxID=2729614 RepID=UPI001D1411E6|nr:aldo/keto reductase [Donghicola mangrovi]